MAVCSTKRAFQQGLLVFSRNSAAKTGGTAVACRFYPMKVSDLRGILQYVPRFREKIFVVAVDGDIVASENFSNILLDVAVLRSLSIKVILVHGVAAQVEKLAAERGVKISNSDGIGVTDDATLKVSIEAASQVTNDIMQGLTTVDLRAA